MLMDSLNGQTGDTVTLLSPEMTFLAHSSLSFSFYMHLNDTDAVGALAVYRYSPLLIYDTVLFMERGNRGSSWLERQVCIPTGTYRLAFVGTVGLTSLSDIAIDNIEIIDDKDCDYFTSTSPAGNVICPIAIAYSMGQIIESVCVCQCVSMSVRLWAISRSHFLIDFHQNWDRHKNLQKEKRVR